MVSRLVEQHRAFTPRPLPSWCACVVSLLLVFLSFSTVKLSSFIINQSSYFTVSQHHLCTFYVLTSIAPTCLLIVFFSILFYRSSLSHLCNCSTQKTKKDIRTYSKCKAVTYICFFLNAQFKNTMLGKVQ